MFKSIFMGVCLVAGSLTASGTAGFAQSTDASNMSAEQLQELFSRQKTRGLVIAPTTPEVAGASDAATAGTSVVTATEAPSTTTQTPAAASDASPTYVALAPEDQVNIQISFDFDSSALRADQKPKLATLCKVMQSIDVKVFRIVGHTDSAGSADYNERLSLLRAQEVKRYLTDECGIDAARLEATGVGEDYPLDAADPRSDVNRRVEFQALS